MTLEQHLKQKRVSLGLTQADMGRLLNQSSAQYWSNSERGYSGLSYKHFKKVSKKLGVPLEVMINMRCEDVKRALRKKLMGRK